MSTRAFPRMGLQLCGLLLLGSVSLAGCSPQRAVVAAAPTPLPPAALATIPPPKPAHPTAGAGPAVTVENFNFVAASVTVPAGTTVVWTNADDVEHTVTAFDNSFSSPAIEPDAQFSYTFATPGTYSYFCAIHPFMTGKVIVQ